MPTMREPSKLKIGENVRISKNKGKKEVDIPIDVPVKGKKPMKKKGK